MLEVIYSNITINRILRSFIYTTTCHNVLKTVQMDFKHTARVHLRSVDKTWHDSLKRGVSKLNPTHVFSVSSLHI